MASPSDSLLAQRLLEYRERGYTFGSFYRRNRSRYLLLVLGCALAAVGLGMSRLWPISFLALGMAVGSMLRDLGWLRSARRTWPFTAKVTDWVAVEKLARGE